jgi:nitrate reductase beta subunit
MTPTASRKRPASPNDKDLYKAQCDIFLDPNDPKVIEQARKDGIPDNWLDAARKVSPVYKMAMEWKVALPLHPEYRTLPMVWYIPPLSPITAAANAGHLGSNGEIPDVNQLRIPVQVPGQPADGGRHPAGGPGAGAHAGHARLPARPSTSTASATTRCSTR